MSAALFDTLRTVAFGSITNSYAVLGSALTKNFRVLRIVNNTNGDMFLSTDGTNNQIFVPAGSFVLYDLSTNSQNIAQSDGLSLKIGTQFYVKYSTAPTSGAIYIEGIYTMGV